MCACDTLSVERAFGSTSETSSKTDGKNWLPLSSAKSDVCSTVSPFIRPLQFAVFVIVADKFFLLLKY